MANSNQADKRARQNVAHRARNVVYRTRFRTFQKRVVKAVQAKDQDQAKACYAAFVPIADATAGKGVIHPNKAARIKSRLNAMVKGMAAAKAK
ncbi:MAG: 30S ribosomal protein S20 [Betaproteobacteria bacterium AqS2]|uniref:Small ribosomal subunit protein bS20 n=1 Tax=Candidatus Amphirhobacter heronislandensis TaxID=1732024 RepID=A0A930UFM7_9GAMM|nr:30S ribosomal protein S20 [Betaproteobacteria bacterium AqS2]